MSKQKMLKIISASAIAASAFVVTTPSEAATVSQADKLVQTAKATGNILKWAISIEGTADGTTRPWTAYNNAKKAYDEAVKAVNTLPAAQKNKYLAELDQHVKLHINRTMAYIDAITAGENIRSKQRALTYQMDLNVINDETEKAYHELSKEIRKQAILLDRVYGQSTRDLIRSQYKQSAEKVRDNAIYPVTVKIELDLAQKALAAKNAAQAEKHIAEAKKYLRYVDNSTMKNALNNRLTTMETTYVAKVEKISAAEPKRIKVDFNKAMLSGSGTNGAENTANYAVSSRSIKSVKLSDDKKSAIIELYDSLYTNTTYTVTVKKNIQTANYETLAQTDYTSSFTFNDTTKPTVSFVTTDSNGNLEIKFSEMIDSSSPLNVTLNGKSVSINSYYYDSDTITVSKSELDRIGLQKGKYYSIVVTGARDLVVNYPNTMNTYNGTFFYNSLADTSAPFVRNVQRSGERTFTIEFSETLIDLTASHLVITKGSTSIRPQTVKDISGNKTKFEVELPTSVYGTNESSVYLTIQMKNYRDLANNVAQTTNHSVTITKDVSPLTFTSSTFNIANNEFQFTFNKTLSTGTPVASKITIYGPDNSLITPTFKTNSGNKMIIDARKLSDGMYTFIVEEGAVTDNTASKNQNKFFSETIMNKMDITLPEANVITSNVKGQIKVTFSKPVTDTALLHENYKFEGSELSEDTSIELSSDKKLVTITFPEGKITETKEYTITVRNITDLSDNVMKTFNKKVKIIANPAP
ncbi:Ig-like domain-containing protein [Bacillus sp. Bva_UNVM-123]|uniref:Ig-like domain-containing protein n=1 Tax=Bacillus sp. Bva_UNVM-123 TaxID=2829798 RepID=UPI00391F7016